MNNEEKADLEACRLSIKNSARNDRSIRELATNPLLCAMLCALNRQRHRDLPSQRVYLYEEACRMLLEAREKRRGIYSDHYPKINYDERLIILQEIAYWMLNNGYKQAKKDKVVEQIQRIMLSLVRIDPNISPDDIYKYLVERSGIVREPQINNLDFVHLTFQEYLTAKCAVGQNNIGVLIRLAHDQQWREVIILAASLAGETARHELLEGLYRRSSETPAHKYVLRLLIISCANSVIQLDQAVAKSIAAIAAEMPSPKNKEEARAWSNAGRLALPYLAQSYLVYQEAENRYKQALLEARKNKLDARKVDRAKITVNPNDLPDHIVCSCVYALSLIAGDEALETLTTHVTDTRKVVTTELGLAWKSFDRQTYLKKVLVNCRTLTLNMLPTVDEISYLISLVSLKLEDCVTLTNTDILTQLADLEDLELIACPNLVDIDSLKGLRKLKYLKLSYCKKLADLSCLSESSCLQEIELYQCPNLRQITPLQNIATLKKVTVSGIQPNIEISFNRPDIEVVLK